MKTTCDFCARRKLGPFALCHEMALVLHCEFSSKFKKNLSLARRGQKRLQRGLRPADSHTPLSEHSVATGGVAGGPWLLAWTARAARRG
jgi:hypothetical protein